MRSATGLGSEAMQMIVPVAYAYLAYRVVEGGITLGGTLYAYAYPNKENMSKEKEAEKKIATLRTELAFRSCLMENAQKSRNAAGFPTACEECGRTFAMTAGIAAYQDMVETFKAVY